LHCPPRWPGGDHFRSHKDENRQHDNREGRKYTQLEQWLNKDRHETLDSLGGFA